MNYPIKDDINFVCKFLNISLDDFSKSVGVTKEYLSRLLNNKVEPTYDLLNKIYSFINEKIPDLNKCKIKALETKSNLLFHESKSEINEPISLEYSRQHVDFGVGFYAGDNYERSLDFVAQTKEGLIYVLDVNLDNLKILNLDISLDWMLLIAFNRGKLEEYKNTKKYKEIENISKKYDLIIAPIANTRMFTTIDDFINSAISSEQAIHALNDLSLGKQYVFKTNKAIKQIKIVERLFVTTNERKDATLNMIQKIKDSNNFIKNAYQKYSRKGLYVSEVFKDE